MSGPPGQQLVKLEANQLVAQDVMGRALAHPPANGGWIDIDLSGNFRTRQEVLLLRWR